MRRFVSTLALGLLSCVASPTFGQEARPQTRIAEPVLMEIESTVGGSGRVAASRSSDLRPRVFGVVTKVHFPYGGEVQQGDVILELDDRLAKAAVRIKEAGLLRAKAALAHSQHKLERAKASFQSGVAGQEEHDNARTGLDESTASLGEAEALLEVARLELEACRVVAPFAGVLTRSRVSEGEQTSPTSDPFTVLSIVSPATVEASIDSGYAERTAKAFPQGLVGQEIETLIGEKTYKTKVLFAQDAISPREPTNVRGTSIRTFTVIVQLPEGEKFSVGAPARIVIHTGKRNAQLLPATAFQSGQPGFDGFSGPDRALRPGMPAMLWGIGEREQRTQFSVRLEQQVGDFWSFAPDLPAGVRIAIDENLDRRGGPQGPFVVEKLEPPK